MAESQRIVSSRCCRLVEVSTKNGGRASSTTSSHWRASALPSSSTRRHSVAAALGFVAFRVLEAAIIVAGAVSLLSVVSLRQDAAGASGADAAALATTAPDRRMDTATMLGVFE